MGRGRRAASSSEEDDDEEAPTPRRGARRRQSTTGESRAPSPPTPSTPVTAPAAKPRKKAQKKTDGKGKPLELFRSDFISAMRIPDSEFVDKLIRVSDPWRHEWNNGVQIPVGHNEAENASCFPIPNASTSLPFKMPKKLVRLAKDPDFDPDVHTFSNALAKAEEVCRYDLDDLDSAWLRLLNEQRRAQGQDDVEADSVERLMEHFEGSVYEGVQAELADTSAYARGREFEEDSVCDVCWMPDSSDDNQMVFCDRCDLAVHQVCYGTGELPDGTWLCRACTIQPNAQCVLCPNKGGALKCTKSGRRWAHVSCVWWIPEVKFEDAEAMEPVVHLRDIPADRWNLKCALCGKREGACIQCSSHKCPTAYHVTCAQMSQPRVHMKWETAGDGVDLVSFCAKHTELYHARVPGSVPSSPDGPSTSSAPLNASMSYVRPSLSGRSHDSPLKRKLKRQAMLEAKFYAYVSPAAAAKELKLDVHLADAVYEYWKLKRRSRRNESLVTPKVEEELILEKHDREVLMRKVKIFVALRQNLEKARNLLYMVQKRERLKAAYTRVREDNFEALHRLLSPGDGGSRVGGVSSRELERLATNLGPTSSYEAEAFAASEADVDAFLAALPPSPEAPKTVVHLKRIPVAPPPTPPGRRSWEPPDGKAKKKPLYVLKYVGAPEEPDFGAKRGRRSEGTPNGISSPPPKRSRLISALDPSSILATGPLRRSLPAAASPGKSPPHARR